MDKDDPPTGRSERGSSILAAAILGAALILSWGMSSDSPRYQLASAGSSVVRMDTDSGALLACDMQRCVQVQLPDRAKSLGAISFQIGGSDEKPALPAANDTQPAPAQ